MDARRSFRVVSAPGQAAATGRDRLESWKEIAAYLKRGARTVQRWEAEEGLPVPVSYTASSVRFTPTPTNWTSGGPAARPNSTAKPRQERCLRRQWPCCHSLT
jgi:hypothetical protein